MQPANQQQSYLQPPPSYPPTTFAQGPPQPYANTQNIVQSQPMASQNVPPFSNPQQQMPPPPPNTYQSQSMLMNMQSQGPSNPPENTIPPVYQQPPPSTNLPQSTIKI